MGFLDRVIGGVNKAHEKTTDAEYAVFRDRRYDAAERLAQSGEAGHAIITGIRGRWNDETTELVYRLEWNDGGMRAGAIRFGGGAASSLRIGSEVLVRTDGDRVTLDVDGMAAAPGASDIPGVRHRKVPDVGVDDTALDARVLSRLKKWSPVQGIVHSWQRCSTVGIATDNWDIVVMLADGSTATAQRDAVPTYARWFVVPGADVLVAVDPSHPVRMQVDWPRLAEVRAGGRWDDPLPEGSIAAARLADALADGTEAPEPMATMGGEIDTTPTTDDATAIEGVTLETWAAVEAGLIHDRVAPGGYDAYATEHFGVPAGRWTAIAAAWQARQRLDWKVGAAFGEAFEAAQKARKRKK